MISSEHPRPAQWRKSSHSGTSNGSCVEVDDANPGRVRDSKDPHGPTLTFTPTAWQTFITGIRSSDFGSL